jgi:uncharacterized membrane protein YccC
MSKILKNTLYVIILFLGGGVGALIFIRLDNNPFIGMLIGLIISSLLNIVGKKLTDNMKNKSKE